MTIVYIYLIGIVVMTFTIFAVTRYLEISDDMTDDMAFAFVASLFWPILLPIGIILAPFILIDRGIKKMKEKATKIDPGDLIKDVTTFDRRA